MADPGNVLKRPHPEDDENKLQKRSRSNNGSPMPTSSSNKGGISKEEIERMVAEARAKAEAARAKIQAARGGTHTPTLGSGSQTPSTGGAASPALSRLEQIKARVAAATGKVNTTTQPRSPAPPTFMPAVVDDGLSRARGGLDVGLHPALLGDSTQDLRSSKGKQAMQPKFATTMANRRTESPVPSFKPDKSKAPLDLTVPSVEETKSNPYFDPNLGMKTALARPRQSRQLVFNQKGKYIQQAAALRRLAQLEAMKKKIAERARQAGVDEDLDVDKAFLVPPPLLLNDSVITIYIQHPVLLDPPQDKHIPAPKPMFLTPKEQAKIRRQRRMADLKEQQAKIRLGLEPAPPPKVKKSNLMRVLGEEAVKDPTAVEARVNREIAERFEKHVSANESRKLTKEQRLEKLAIQQEQDALKGIHMSVYKIDNLANGRHRFKISKNAEQHNLSGMCIMHPKLNLVIVEGGHHSIAAYKKLMLNRIDWTENTHPNNDREALASWLAAEDEKTGELKDLSQNTCTLVWEGEEKTRAFRKWLGARVCETDAAAKDALSRAKLENFWTLAKSLKAEPV
ncbi:hypothetical protein ACJ72_02602 [Emergomyces africanus]|uniref:Uncharacterized protein n=1 Tax=Emergomyces africanus TaxID=1955775 RepID=A0A1B7P1Z9_9EURO|nr:hypothetical protein ACJ72_02602 [Emergomyces africanus]